MEKSEDLSWTDDEVSYVRLFGHRIHRAWIILVGCGLFHMATVAVVFSPIGLFYVAVCDDMGFARSDISMWQQVHFLVAIPCMPLAVKCLQRFNSRIVLTACILGCALAAFLMGTYTQAWQWCISGALYGSLGALGTLQLAGPIIIGNWFSKRTGVAMGVYGVIGSIAAVSMSPIFSLIIDAVGWRNAYFIQATIILVLGLTFTLFICRLRPSSIGALPYGGIPDEVPDETARRSKVPWRDICSVTFVMLFVFAGVSSLIGSGFDAHLAGHAVAGGYDSFFGSLLISALFLGSGIEKAAMGWLNDKIGVNRTVYIEYIIVAAGMFGLIVCKTPALLLLSAFLFGIQDSFVSISLPLLVRKFFGVEKMPQVLAFASIGSGIFGSFGSRLVGLSYDLTGSFNPAFMVGIGLCFVGAACITVANVIKRRKDAAASKTESAA